MEKGSANKAIKNEEVLNKYFYPQYQVTVEAFSQEEANTKLAALLAEEKK